MEGIRFFISSKINNSGDTINKKEKKEQTFSYDHDNGEGELRDIEYGGTEVP